MDGPEKFSPFMIVWAISFINMITLCVFFSTRGLSICDLPEKARRLVITRSFLYCVSFCSFMVTLRKLNPVSAVLALQTGIIVITVIFRVLAMQQLFYNVTIGKIKSVIILLQIGAIPGLTSVDTTKFNEKNPIREYWAFLIIGMLSGVMLGIVSKQTHKLCRGNYLRHEAYMSFYASCMCVVVVPLFIGIEMSWAKSTKPLSDEDRWKFVRMIGAVFLLSLFKNVYIDRGMMKRFAEDFDAELHTFVELIED